MERTELSRSIRAPVPGDRYHEAVVTAIEDVFRSEWGRLLAALIHLPRGELAS